MTDVIHYYVENCAFYKSINDEMGERTGDSISIGHVNCRLDAQKKPVPIDGGK